MPVPAQRAAHRWVHVVMAVAAGVAVLLVAVSLVIQKVGVTSVLGIPQQPDTHLLDVRSEQNLHTWFNVALLVIAGVGALVVSYLARVAGRPGWPWWTVGLVLAAMSVDDLTALHEGLEHLGRLVAGGSAPHFAWLVPGSLIAVVLLGLVLWAAVRLPPASRRLLVTGFVVFLGAAIGLEFLGGVMLTGVDDIRVYIVVSHLEELLESLGAVLMFGAPLRALYLQRREDGLQLGYLAGGPSPQPSA